MIQSVSAWLSLTESLEARIYNVMPIDQGDSSGARLTVALISAVVGGLGALAIEAVDYFIWDMSWVQANSFVAYITKIWFAPVGVAVI